MRFIKTTLVLANSLFLFGCADMGQSIHNFKQNRENNLLQQYGAMKPAQQTVFFKFPNEKPWKKVDQSITNEGMSMTFVHNNENMSNWTESLRTITVPYHKMPGITAKKLVQIEMNHAKKFCQRSSSHIVSETSKSIIYTINVSGCPGEENQSQIGKAFNGIDAVYAVRYSAMTGKVADSEFNMVANVIKKSELIKNPDAK
jgi:hypothetical protein